MKTKQLRNLKTVVFIVAVASNVLLIAATPDHENNTPVGYTETPVQENSIHTTNASAIDSTRNTVTIRVNPEAAEIAGQDADV